MSLLSRKGTWLQVLGIGMCSAHRALILPSTGRDFRGPRDLCHDFCLSDLICLAWCLPPRIEHEHREAGLSVLVTVMPAPQSQRLLRQ
jgi:hypothetical protein